MRTGWPGDRVAVPPGNWAYDAEEGPGSTGHGGG